MGCINGYCSNGANTLISKDKHYSSIIISNLLSNQMDSNKTNSKFLNINSERQDYDSIDKTNTRPIYRHALSNKELKLPDNPLPFVKIKPKKDFYLY